MLGLGLSFYFPYVIYGLAFVVLVLSVIYKAEVGVIYIAVLIPVYSLVNKTIQLELPLSKDVIDIVILASIVGCALGRREHDEVAVRGSVIGFPIVAFMVYSVFSFFVGSSYLGEGLWISTENVRLVELKNFLIMPLLYFITYHNFRDKRLKIFLFVLVVMAFLVADYKFYTEFRWVKHTRYMDKSRLDGTLGYLGPNEWGSFHTIYCLFFAGLFFLDKDRLRRMVYAVVGLGSMYCIMYSFSRGAYIGIVAGFVFIGIIKNRKILLPVILIFIFWKAILPTSVIDRIEGTFVENGERSDTVAVGDANLETAGRTEIWERAFGFFAKNPVLGTGFGTHMRMTGWDTHNMYLKFMVEQGMLGLAIYLWLYVLAFRSGWRLFRRSDQEMVRALGFGFVCAVVGSMVVNFFGDRWTYLQLGGLYWIIWGLVDQENAKLHEGGSGGEVLERTWRLVNEIKPETGK